MSDIQNPSYETALKRLQQIYQQSVTNKQEIIDRQPDNSKIYLENNWLQNVGQIDDTGDQPVASVGFSTLLSNITTYLPESFLPVIGSITPGQVPSTATFSYDDVLPGVDQTTIPFLEFQTSLTATQKLMSGYDFTNIDTYLSDFEVMANGTTIWTGENPPTGSQIQISKYQNDNGYATFTIPAYHLSFKSSTGGIYGNGSLVGVEIISVLDETTNTAVPLDDNLENFPPDGTHQYSFNVWSNADQLQFTLQYSLMTPGSVTIARDPYEGYIAMWAATGEYSGTPFYIYEDVLSGGIIDLYLIPPAINESMNTLSPITFTINADGPVKWSDLAGGDASEWVSSTASYDPFFFRQSQSTDADEVWQGVLSYGAVVLSDGIEDDEELEVYNDSYDWQTIMGTPQWVRTPDHTTQDYPRYVAGSVDITGRVVVVARPKYNWKENKKYQY